MVNYLLLAGAGIILFLRGMLTLSSLMQTLVSVRMKNYIRLVVQNRAYGLFLGIVATILFQSSTATTVLTVGLTSAGLISFYHSLAVVLGADLGTTVTIQMIAWKIGDISPLFLIAGGLGWFVTEGRIKQWSEALFSFGLMFFGLYLVGLATIPLKSDTHIMEIFRTALNPLAAFAVGVVFTAIVHASAIPIGILVLLASDGLVSLTQSLPIVFGANVGTTITAILAAFVSTPPGRRTAMAHFFFKATGAVVLLPVSHQLATVIGALTSNPAQQIVFAHLAFNTLIVVVFFFLTRPVAYLIEWLSPGEEQTVPLGPEYLTRDRLANPAEALEAARKEILRQGEISQRMFALAMKATVSYRSSHEKDIRYLELVQNNLREEIIAYLRRISAHDLSPALARQLFAYTAISDDIERMCNHMVDLVKLAHQKAMRHISFTSHAMVELDVIKNDVEANLNEVIALIKGAAETRKTVKSVTFREERIDTMVKQAHNNHLVRFHKGICQAEAGPIFLEMLIHLERISDHCQNVADYWSELEG